MHRDNDENTPEMQFLRSLLPDIKKAKRFRKLQIRIINAIDEYFLLDEDNEANN